MPVIFYVQERLKQAFFDSSLVVRKTVSSVMSMIIVRGGFNAWPELLTFLTDKLHGTEPDIQENSILAISIIVEDCSSLF